MLGVVVGAGIVLRGRTIGTALPLDTAARPTFIIASAPSPSPAVSPSPTVPSAQSTVPPERYDDYTVAPGDSLRSIALRLYGDSEQWVRIYDANRAAIGADPDAIVVGARLRIPRP